jgi:hypothetical protein
MVTAMDVPVIVPVTPASEYADIALVELAGVPLLPPHPATTAASNNAMNHTNGFEVLANLFICFTSFILSRKASLQSTDSLLVLFLMCYVSVHY